MKCPLKSHEYSSYVDCAGRSCALADEAGQCLVKQALQCYVSAERTRVAEENDRLRRETELARVYQTTKVDAYNTPVPGGITYSHITPTDKQPHGGWFEDLEI